MRVALQGVTPAGLARLAGGTEAEARRIVSAVHRDLPPFAPMAGVTRATRERVAAVSEIPRLEVVTEERSQVDPFVKYLLRAPDGARLETVRIPLERRGRFSVCVSSQVGCALACAFCATGRLGLARNLATWEIVEQVRVVRRALREETAGTLAEARGATPGGSPTRVHGVVFQGMGEPLANVDRVLEAIAVLSDPSGPAIDARAMTVCTAGLPGGIRRLAEEAPKVRLGLSLGSARREVRRRLMPIEASHAFSEVLEAARVHATTTGLAPMWALTPLAGVNDHEEDAAALATEVHDFAARTGLRPRVSLVPYNAIGASAPGEVDPFARASEEQYARFHQALAQRGVHAHRRYSGGGDVRAACGQLVAGEKADDAASDARPRRRRASRLAPAE